MPGETMKKIFWTVLAAACLFGILFLVFQSNQEARIILAKAVQAYGGEQQLARTLTGWLKARAKGKFPPDLPFAIGWEEWFQLPERYKRIIDGEMGGQPFRLEYAVIEGNGW